MPREVGDWTRDKLKILEDYLPGYLGATTRALERVYIDAFAGPGLNTLRTSRTTIEGSPLIALKATARNGTRFDRLVFIEQDADTATELEETLKSFDVDKRSEIRVGDVNKELPNLIKSINLRTPTFVFLDTDGIEPKWSTIEAIAEWRTELLINFPLGMSINRNLESSKVTAYFGTEQWEPLRSVSRRTRALLDLYKQRLKDLGYEYPTENDRLIKGSGGQHLYYLVFVSKRPVAKRIMTWVLKQPGATGQTRMDI